MHLAPLSIQLAKDLETLKTSVLPVEPPLPTPFSHVELLPVGPGEGYLQYPDHLGTIQDSLHSPKKLRDSMSRITAARLGSAARFRPSAVPWSVVEAMLPPGPCKGEVQYAQINRVSCGRTIVHGTLVDWVLGMPSA